MFDQATERQRKRESTGDAASLRTTEGGRGWTREDLYGRGGTVDTNGLVYRFDPPFPNKQRIATELLHHGIEDDSIRVPHQAIVEFVAAVTRPFSMARISDPHGIHDWSSKEYVQDWAKRQDRYEDERRPQFQILADAIPFAKEAPIEILDVGAGYGALAQFLLAQFPNARAVCQDGSEEMAKLGRRRMANLKGRFDYVVADFSQPGWTQAIDGSFDAVVSTIAIHNVRVPGIIEDIYKEIFHLVKPGGCFLNLDLVFVPLTKQLAWLRAAGFSDVRSYWHEGREALFGGRKL